MIGTKNIDWRPLLYMSQIEINSEVLPVDLTHQGSLGVVQMHLDMIPSLTRNELLTEDHVLKQCALERKFEQDGLNAFLEYAN